MFEMTLLMQLQNTHFVEGQSMQDHLIKMVDIQDCLIEAGNDISDDTFILYIWTSLFHVQMYWSLLVALNTAATQTSKKLTSNSLINTLIAEDTTTTLQSKINKMSSTLMASSSKSGNQRPKGDTKGRAKVCSNPNCKRTGHKIENC